MKRLFAFALALVLTGCTTTNPGGQPSSSNNVSSGNAAAWRIQSVASGLEVPWSIIFTSDERMLVTERPGRLREIINGTLTPHALLEFSDVSTRSEEGLMGLTKDPAYDRNAYLYVCVAEDRNGLHDRVVRLIDEGSSIREDKTLIQGIPAARYHAGCELAFGPDGKLYITTGDATDRAQAQDLKSLGGKILRINSDGSIPADNPFRDSPIWSYGHRNPQGIDWTGDVLLETEHGPSGFDGPGGGDEVNRIEKGANYGWPLVSHNKIREGTVKPLRVFTPAEAPGSLIVYDGDTFPNWNGDVFFAALKGEGIWHLKLSDDALSIAEEEKLELGIGRIRELTVGPDGLIYFTTSNRDGRGSPRSGDDHIYRIVPK